MFLRRMRFQREQGSGGWSPVFYKDMGLGGCVPVRDWGYGVALPACVGSVAPWSQGATSAEEGRVPEAPLLTMTPVQRQTILPHMVPGTTSP